MSLFQTNKPKSAAKIMIPPGKDLEGEILSTVNHIASMVGVTLGPGGKQVLIERPEIGADPIVTKDGVTVIKSLGYESATKQLILETVRNASTRTANEAGDGTTSSAILANKITQETFKAVKENTRTSPQSIVREMQSLVPYIEKKIDKYKTEINGDNYISILTEVAKLSANGDSDLAKVIIDGLETVGEEGDMTIIESSGDSKYDISKINGYTVDRGYDESTRGLSSLFINDKTGTAVVLDKPIVLLYDGIIQDASQILEGLNRIDAEVRAKNISRQDVALVCHGISEQFLGDLQTNWSHQSTKVKVYPVISPERPILNWRTNFLFDLQAYVKTPVFNPINKPLNELDAKSLVNNNQVTKIEVFRYKTMVFAVEDEETLNIRVEELKAQRETPESEYELNDLNVRIGKLTSGIVRLVISGPTPGETREKRDRAEDAWMAIKGAIKHGALPGGGYVLVKLAADMAVLASGLQGTERIAADILSRALLAPVELLYENYGYSEEDITAQITAILNNDEECFDILKQEWVSKLSLLDSAPAVIEAIKNSLSIASLLGTMGGIVSFKRDTDTDKAEEKLVRDFEKAIGQRGSLGN